MRYLLLGDTHGSIPAMEMAIAEAQAEGCNRIFQLGDFGYFFHSEERLFQVSEMAQEADMPIDFLDGNHENFEILGEMFGATPDDPFATEIVPLVTYHPRGYVWEHDGVRFGAFGGAVSIDKDSRTPGESWWPQELITEPQVQRVEGADIRVDVMLSHDVPLLGKVLKRYLEAETEYYRVSYKLDALSANSRYLLNRVYKAWEPMLGYHGHYHYHYKEDGVVGLSCNGEHNSTRVIDTLALKDLARRR